MSEVVEPADFCIVDDITAKFVGVNHISLGEIDLLTASWELYQGDNLLSKSESYELKDYKNDVIRLFADEIEKAKGKDCSEFVLRSLENPPPWCREKLKGDKRIVRKFDPCRHANTDEGNANRFEDECKGWLVFDKDCGKWFSWMGTYWGPAEERAEQSAREVGKTVILENCAYFGDAENKAHDNHAFYSQSQRAQRDMVSMAKANMSVSMSEVSDTSLIACKNGIIDSNTGEFVPVWYCKPMKEKFPTVYIDCEYKPGLRSEKWNKHLETVMSDNTTERLSDEERKKRCENLVAYLKRLFGYALFKGNPERIFVFFWGEGRNGKSTTTTVLHDILGDQAGMPALSQLYAVDSDKPAPSICAALPRRLATFSEADGDAPVSVSAFKELTGEKFTTRFRMMHKNNEKTPINCLPIGVTNDLPKFDKPVEFAMLSRLITIPFKHVFAEENRDVLGELLAEKDAVFSEMVDELRSYIKEGLPKLHACARTTQDELLIGDELYRFFDEHILPCGNNEESMTRRELKERLIDWAKATGADIDTRSQREADGYFVEVLTKRQTERLFGAARILGYKESKSDGKRYFRCKYVEKKEDIPTTIDSY